MRCIALFVVLLTAPSLSAFASAKVGPPAHSFTKNTRHHDTLVAAAYTLPRIIEYLEGGEARNSLIDTLLPTAHATGAVGAFSLSATTYANSAALKAEACQEDEFSDELAGTCSLMAVSMKGVRSSDDPEELLPISLKCPSENKGTLELIKMNRQGILSRLQITYKNGEVTIITVGIAEADRDDAYRMSFRINMLSPEDADEKEYGEAVAKMGNSLRDDVCAGSREERDRYFSLLKANATKLRTSAP
jgi:hypothetical protein